MAIPFSIPISNQWEFLLLHILASIWYCHCSGFLSFWQVCSGVQKSFYILYMQLLSPVQLFATPWTWAHQLPLLGFSRQEYWNGLPFPSPFYTSLYNCFISRWQCFYWFISLKNCLEFHIRFYSDQLYSKNNTHNFLKTFLLDYSWFTILC